MCSTYKVEVNVFGVFLDLVLKLVERFEVGFATDGSEVSSLKEGVLVVNRSIHGG